MILSHRHRFIFIKGLKVGGTSVELALSSLCGPEDIIAPLFAPDERLRLAARNFSDDRATELSWLERVASGENANFKGARYYNHMPLTEVLELQGELPGYRVLFVERNPYAKVLSWLSWRDNIGRYTEEQRFTASKEEVATAFDGSIARVHNIDRYRLPSGEVAAPGWRYETLQEDFSEFVESLDVAVPDLPHVKRGLMSNTLDPREWLSPQQIETVNELFADEFAQFGYPTIRSHAP